MESSTLDCHFAPVFTSVHKTKNPQVPTQPKGFPKLPANWVVEFEVIPQTNGHIFAHLFRAEKSQVPHKAIIALHGRGEHSGRYMHLPHFLGDLVGSIYAIDHKGHGQSSGTRGHIAHFDDYANDSAMAVKRYSRYLEKRYGKAEIHLLGHSMGGLIAMRMLQLHPELNIASVTLSAPMFELAFKVPAVQHLGAKLLNRFVPGLSLPGPPLGDLVSSDPEVVKHYKSDRYNTGLSSSAFYMGYLETKPKLIAKARDFRHPLLFMVPKGDRVIDPFASLQLYDKIQAPEKKLIVYDDFYHEIMNEPGKERVFKDIRDWIAGHTNSTQ